MKKLVQSLPKTQRTLRDEPKKSFDIFVVAVCSIVKLSAGLQAGSLF